MILSLCLAVCHEIKSSNDCLPVQTEGKETPVTTGGSKDMQASRKRGAERREKRENEKLKVWQSHTAFSHQRWISDQHTLTGSNDEHTHRRCYRKEGWDKVLCHSGFCIICSNPPFENLFKSWLSAPCFGKREGEKEFECTKAKVTWEKGESKSCKRLDDGSSSLSPRHMLFWLNQQNISSHPFWSHHIMQFAWTPHLIELWITRKYDLTENATILMIVTKQTSSNRSSAVSPSEALHFRFWFRWRLDLFLFHTLSFSTNMFVFVLQNIPPVREEYVATGFNVKELWLYCLMRQVPGASLCSPFCISFCLFLFCSLLLLLVVHNIPPPRSIFFSCFHSVTHQEPSQHISIFAGVSERRKDTSSRQRREKMMRQQQQMRAAKVPGIKYDLGRREKRRESKERGRRLENEFVPPYHVLM